MPHEYLTSVDPDWVIEQFQNRQFIIKLIGYPVVASEAGVDSVFLLRVLAWPTISDKKYIQKFSSFEWETVLSTIDELAKSKLEKRA